MTGDADTVFAVPGPGLSRTGTWDRGGNLPFALLLIGGCVNQIAPIAIASVELHGFTLAAFSMFDVSPCVVVVLWLSAEALLAKGAGVGPSRVATLLYAAGILIPSGLVSSLATLAYSGWSWRGAIGEGRRGMSLVTGFSMCNLWWAIGAKSFGSTFDNADAFAASKILGFLTQGVVRRGNTIITPLGNETAVLEGCSTALALPLLVVTMLALASKGGASMKAMVVSALALTVTFTCLNVARIAVLSWSDETYHLGHGPVGSGLFDLASVLMVFGFAALAERKSAFA